MKTYGLIGYRLGHSFSKRFFTEKFEKENLKDHEYVNFELDSIEEFPGLFKRHDHLYGLNCTIPYKQQIMPFLDEIHQEAAAAGAVNTIRIIRQAGRQQLIGYNTDIYGFEHSFRPLLREQHKKALILGTGGASKAVKYVLNKLQIDFLSATTKAEPGSGEIPYQDISVPLLKDFLIVIQTTPLGMFPNTASCPELPWDALTSNHLLFDLVYNPEETLFMKRGRERGATVKGGLEMLHLQAIRSWEIWNED
ncbi:MAG: shikimate dehydrogenase [Prolixibacteraceae bacterium]